MEPNVTGTEAAQAPVEQTTTATPNSSGNQTSESMANVGQKSEGMEEVENLRKALKAERDRFKQYRQSMAGQRTQPQVSPEGSDDILNHPQFQELQIKNATYELKEAAKEILERYPKLPDPVKKAILRNPRGFVNENTADVPNAIQDIEDYLEEVYGEYNVEAPTAPPQTAPTVIGNNNINQGKQDISIQELLSKPPADLTPDEIKLLASQTKR